MNLSFRRIKISFVLFVGSSLFSLGFIAILGYLIGNPLLYTWPASGTSVAMPTAIGFGLTGLSFMAIASELEKIP